MLLWASVITTAASGFMTFLRVKCRKVIHSDINKNIFRFQCGFWLRPALLRRPLSKFAGLQGLEYAELCLILDLQNSISPKIFNKFLVKLNNKRLAKKKPKRNKWSDQFPPVYKLSFT